MTSTSSDDVEEIRTLGKTLANRRSEILAHHTTGASNGPTEGLNLCVKKVKRAGHGFRCFNHYRLGVLLKPAGSPGPTDRNHLGSGPALPNQTRRATKGH